MAGALVSRGIPTKTIGVVLGLAGFVIAVLAGMAAGNESSTVLLRALAALVGCNAIGLVIGAAGERAILQHVADYQKSNPISESDGAGAADSAEEDNGVLVV